MFKTIFTKSKVYWESQNVQMNLSWAFDAMVYLSFSNKETEGRSVLNTCG